jgi:hypothetical protein
MFAALGKGSDRIQRTDTCRRSLGGASQRRILKGLSRQPQVDARRVQYAFIVHLA